MKTIITTLIAVIALSHSASAAPGADAPRPIIISSLLYEHNEDGEIKVLGKANVFIMDGQRGVITIEKRHIALTPTLLDDGRVLINMVLSDCLGEEINKVFEQELVARLDQMATFSNGEITFVMMAQKTR